MTTGQCIKAARKAAGLTQRELSERLGLAYQTLAQWENDLRNPKYETLQRISDALSIDVYELLGDEARSLFVQGEASTLSYYLKQGYTFTTSEKLYIKLFHLLNESGQSVAIERISELTEVPKYQRQDSTENRGEEE